MDGHGVRSDRWTLALLAQLGSHGGLVAHELIEPDTAKRELARRELDWWCAAARRGAVML